MQSSAKTVAAYLASLAPERRAAVAAVRDAILANLDADYQEGMSYGMIGYCVPHRVYPAGYHCKPDQPLPFACLAAQKRHCSLHVMSLYDGGDEARWLREAWQRAGKKLDMGKCCIRFQHQDDVPLDVVGELIRRMPARKWVAYYQSVLDPRTGRPRSSRTTTAGKGGRQPRTDKAKVTKRAAAAGKRRTAAGQQRRRK